MILARFRKQPNERRKFLIDYSERLAEGDALLSIQQTVITPDTTPPLTVSSGINAEGTELTTYVSGGSDNTEYKVEYLVETNDNGVLWEDELIFMVEDV
jgi:hypothetical protein